uniref:FlgD Ig-like domain-containing protein n=1 Tax=candidate division WOR-3 bacterium TaxID=2052148 RepID=A0A7C4TIL7_UNCW3
MTEKELKNIFKGLKIGLVLIIGIIFICLFITIKSFLSSAKESKLKTPEQDAEDRAEMISQVLSPVCVSPILEEDALTLNEIITGVKEKAKELNFISVLKPGGEILAHTDLDKIGEIEEVTQGQNITESLFIYTTPIKLQEEVIAYLKLGLNKNYFSGQRPETQPAIFPRRVIILFFGLFMGLLLITILLANRVQKGIKKSLEKIISEKDAEIRYLHTERKRLQKMVDTSIIAPTEKPKPSEIPPIELEIEKRVEAVPQLVPGNDETLSDKIDKVFADFIGEGKIPESKPAEIKRENIEKEIEPVAIGKSDEETVDEKRQEEETIIKEKKFSKKDLEVIKEIEELLEKPSPIIKRVEQEKPMELEPVDIGKIPLDDTDLKKEIGKEPVKTSLDDIKSKLLVPNLETIDLGNWTVEKIVKEMAELKKDYQIRKERPMVKLENLSITPSTISPGEIATIKFTLSERASILVTIEGPDGCIVRVFNYKGEKGENTLTWDGKNLFGQFCIAGEYRVLIKEKKLGDVKNIAEPIKIILTDNGALTNKNY